MGKKRVREDTSGNEGRGEEKNLESGNGAGADVGGKNSMQWLLGADISAEHFFDIYWEKKPMVVKRGCKEYYGKLFDREILLKVLKAQKIDFGAGVTIAKHDATLAGKDNHAAAGKDWHGELPLALHPTGRATVDMLKQLFASGHTAQVFATQKKCKEVRQLCHDLESELQSLIGATGYLTPPGSQGIAPHHDDVEVFILQTQGSKSWQLFSPQRELSHKYEKTPPGTLEKPMLEVTLEQGDMLYIPRGVIHQAKTANEFSTHLTISTYQAQSWGDFLEGIHTYIHTCIHIWIHTRAYILVTYIRCMACMHTCIHIHLRILYILFY